VFRNRSVFNFSAMHHTLDIWRIDLTHCEQPLPDWEAILDADEQTRAKRYLSAEHRRRFVIAHVAQRMILSQYYQQEAVELKFSYANHGKPSIVQATTGPTWQFNLTHSGELALLAVTTASAVGIDVEAIRPRESMGDLARRYFAAEEVACWSALPTELQEQAFYLTWTRKEAYVKALGMGLTLPLDQFVVTVDPRQPARLVSTQHNPLSVQQWQLCNLADFNDYAAAAVIPSGKYELSHRIWDGR
jgi:4'-phosphopantetheinyl transferase